MLVSKFSHDVPVVLEHPTEEAVRAMPSFRTHFKGEEAQKVTFEVRAGLETFMFRKGPRNYRTFLVAFLDGNPSRKYMLREDTSKIHSVRCTYLDSTTTSALEDADLVGAITARDWRARFRL